LILITDSFTFIQFHIRLCWFDIWKGILSGLPLILVFSSSIFGSGRSQKMTSFSHRYL